MARKLVVCQNAAAILNRNRKSKHATSNGLRGVNCVIQCVLLTELGPFVSDLAYLDAF